jgi:hypothetical protein
LGATETFLDAKLAVEMVGIFAGRTADGPFGRAKRHVGATALDDNTGI